MLCYVYLALTLCFCAVSAQVNEIAFSAGVTKDLTIQHAEVVKFDRIFTNIGRGYNSLTGVFSCPTSGIYVFQVYLKAVDSRFGADTIIYGQSNEVYSTFSGYLIAPVYEEIPAVGK